KQATPAQAEFFEKSVRPLLAARCFECHGPDKHKGDLRLDTRAMMMEGGTNGPAIVPGDPKASLLIQAIHYDGSPKMPPKGKLPAARLGVLPGWVRQAAPCPEPAATVRPPAGEKGFQVTAKDRAFWSFQPVSTPTPPEVRDGAWVQSPIDRFVLAGLEANHLAPAPPADRRALLRRVTFDLTGLPPTPEEMDAFLQDDGPDAFAKVVDRLLASPPYPHP